MWVMLTVQILPSDLEKRTKWSLSGEGRTEAILELEESNTNPIFLHVCELNIVNAETGQNFELKVQC